MNIFIDEFRHQHHIALKKTLNHNTNVCVTSAALLLKQILINFIDNVMNVVTGRLLVADIDNRNSFHIYDLILYNIKSTLQEILNVFLVI